MTKGLCAALLIVILIEAALLGSLIGTLVSGVCFAMMVLFVVDE